MKKKLISYILVFAIVFSLIPTMPFKTLASSTSWTEQVTAKPGGYVENGSTITISSPEGLAWLTSVVNGLNSQTANDLAGKTVTLTGNIDISGHDWTPIGTKEKSFKGTFNGNNKSISELTINLTDINSETYLGLFGYAESATVKDLNISGSITGKAAKNNDNFKFYAGGIMAYGKDISIDNCHNSVGISIEGDINTTNSKLQSYVGGIIGEWLNKGNISNCSNRVEIKTVYGGSSHCGGIVACSMVDIVNDFGYIKNCFNTGNVKVHNPSGESHIGGIIGTQNLSQIENSFSIGRIICNLKNSSTIAYGGGISGFFPSGTIVNCYSDMNIDSLNNPTIGGIVGSYNSSNTIENCYWTYPTNGIGTNPQPQIQKFSKISEGAVSGGSANLSYDFGSGDIRNITLRMALNDWVGKQDAVAGYKKWIVSSSLSTDKTCYVEEWQTPCKIEVVKGKGSGDYLDSTGTGQSDGENVWIVADPPEEGKTFDKWTVSSSKVTSISFLEGGAGSAKARFRMKSEYDNIIITATYKAIISKVTFESNGGSSVPSIEDVAYDAKITKPADPTKMGYSFNGWYKEEGLITSWNFNTDTVKENITLYAKWAANTNTAYKVEHYQQNIDRNAYNLESTENRTGTTDTTVTATAKDYTGFSENQNHQDRVASGIIKGDGSLILKLYYDINTYSVTFESNGGSPVSSVENVAYDTKIIKPEDPVRDGYNFDAWYREEELTNLWDFETDTVKSAMTLYAKWIANTNIAYKVEHYQGNIEGNDYELKETENLTGTTDSLATAKAKDYTGFSENTRHTSRVTSGTIEGDGSLTLKLYYDRNSYTISVEDDGKGSGLAEPSEAVIGKEISLTSTANSGYRLKRWEIIGGEITISNNKFIMPGEDVKIKAIFERIPSPPPPVDPEPEPTPDPTPDPDKPQEPVKEDQIKDTGKEIIIDVSTGGSSLDPEQTRSLIEANKEKDIEIKGENYTITFPVGSMREGEGQGQGSLDLGLEIIGKEGEGGSRQGEKGQALLALADGSGIMALSFKHSGPLPGTAIIEIEVGKEYSGQTLYYYYHNPTTGKLEYMQSAQVNSEGLITVSQDHCSDYILSKELIENENVEKEIERIWGQNRYQTAIKIAKEYFKEGAKTVVLARGDSSADALPAVPLAKYYDAPLVLTKSKELPEGLINTIKELGAEKVIIIGGEKAISLDIAKELEKNGLTIERIYGKDRYETAAAIGRKLYSLGLNKENPRAILVNGNNAEKTYADALSISAWAGYEAVPILYADSRKNELPQGTSAIIKEQGIRKTYLIGGREVVPSSLESKLVNPERLGGKDRFETNLAILENLQDKSENLFIATGYNYADALAIGAVAARDNSWILLTGTKDGKENKNGLTKDQEKLLASKKEQVKNLTAIGGEGAVAKDTLEAVKALRLNKN